MKLWKIVPLEEIGKYRVGDRVYSPNFGEGIVTEIDKNRAEYPIKVEWLSDAQYIKSETDYYSIDGKYFKGWDNLVEFNIFPMGDHNSFMMTPTPISKQDFKSLLRRIKKLWQSV